MNSLNIWLSPSIKIYISLIELFFFLSFTLIYKFIYLHELRNSYYIDANPFCLLFILLSSYPILYYIWQFKSNNNMSNIKISTRKKKRIRYHRYTLYRYNTPLGPGALIMCRCDLVVLRYLV